jgi:gluconolactonase
MTQRLRSCIQIVLLLIFMPQAWAQTKLPPLSVGTVNYKDAELEKLIPHSSKIEMIGSGFQHIEGPVWVKDSSMLLFSDTKGQVIYRWVDGKGTSKFLENTGYTGRLPYSEEPGSNGLAIDKSGNVFICEHGDRRIAAFPLNAKYGRRTLTDNIEGKRYNSPNDIVIKSDGSIYFTDPVYGLPKKETDPTREINITGVYKMAANRIVKAIITDLPAPNGLAFSPDEKKLYVSVSSMAKPVIMVYEVKEDGTVNKGKLFFDASSLPKEQEKQVLDGLKTDSQGNIWASGPGRILIINSAGKLLGNITTGEIISNCAWGNDGTTLYMTAGSFLYRLKTLATGKF